MHLLLDVTNLLHRADKPSFELIIHHRVLQLMNIFRGEMKKRLQTTQRVEMNNLWTQNILNDYCEHCTQEAQAGKGPFHRKLEEMDWETLEGGQPLDLNNKYVMIYINRWMWVFWCLKMKLLISCVGGVSLDILPSSLYFCLVAFCPTWPSVTSFSATWHSWRRPSLIYLPTVFYWFLKW